jgi:hypothetical protein
MTTTQPAAAGTAAAATAADQVIKGRSDGAVLLTVDQVKGAESLHEAIQAKSWDTVRIMMEKLWFRMCS